MIPPRRNNQPYQTIAHPTVNQLSLILIPALCVYFYMLVENSFSTWAIVILVISILSFFGALIYFCVKQKCYTQLFRTCFSVIMGGVILFMSFFFRHTN